ncbi:cytochrome P450 3A24-like [Ptychodera flava]|uniref:cytochrome P450 3A24-like n=1 Tax=Ptychodera flava TaxID=63121 RepID=UPI00396A7175
MTDIFGVLPLSWGLVLVAIVLLYLYLTAPYSTFTKMGLSGPKPLPMFGSMLAYRKGLCEVDREWLKKYGRVYGEYQGRRPVLVMSDPELIKQLTVKNFSSFVNRRDFPLRSKPFNDGLTALRDDKWRNVRNTLTPAFSGSKMRLMTSLLNECADVTVRVLERHVNEDKIVKLKQFFGGYSLDGIAMTSFGVDISSQETPNHPFVENIKKLVNVSLFSPVFIILFFFPFLIPLLNYLDISNIPKSVRKYLLSIVDDTINLRKQEDGNNKRTDLLQLMLNAHELYEKYIQDGGHKEGDEVHNGPTHVGKASDYHKGFTNSEITAQSSLFLLAGYETTSTLLACLAYSLAVNPDVQEKLIAEIEEVMAEKETPGYDDLGKMHYLDMVINETLRAYPPAVRIERVCNEATTIGGISIPEGMLVSVPVFAVHFDPELYPDPDKFDPERFSKEEKEKRHPFAWLPFGAGPRNCIGMRFALMSTKIAVVRTLRKFTFEPCAETPIPLKPGKNSRVIPPEDVPVKVKARE